MIKLSYAELLMDWMENNPSFYKIIDPVWKHGNRANEIAIDDVSILLEEVLND